MRVRPFQLGDTPTLRNMAEASGFPYIDPTSDKIEALMVVVDEFDVPVAACAAERIVQLYLWCEDQHPAAKMRALRMLHQEMAPALKAKGYDECNGFFPPQLAASFGRRLERSFGWVRNWTSWCKQL